MLDVKAVLEFYADDAIRMPWNMTVMRSVQNIHIKEFKMKWRYQKEQFNNRISWCFGNEIDVIDYGKTTLKDSTGKNYIQRKIFNLLQKPNLKYVAVRDMINDDAK